MLHDIHRLVSRNPYMLKAQKVTHSVGQCTSRAARKATGRQLHSPAHCCNTVFYNTLHVLRYQDR